jgi:hypothetical protein
MPRPVTADELLAALARRYDHQSARVILSEALARAGLAPAESFDPPAVSRLAWVMNSLGDRAEPAAKALLELAGEAASAEVPGPEDVAVPEDEVPALLMQVAQAAVAAARARHEAPRLEAAPRVPGKQ